MYRSKLSKKEYMNRVGAAAGLLWDDIKSDCNKEEYETALLDVVFFPVHVLTFSTIYFHKFFERLPNPDVSC